MFSKQMYSVRWLSTVGFIVAVCTLGLSPTSTPSVMAEVGSQAWEFNNPPLDSNLDSYIPKAGPSFSLSLNPGYLRMILPTFQIFDHWTHADNAPQLRFAAPSGDWELSTRLRVLTPLGDANYHTGLMVAFSKLDLMYWGIYRGNEIRLERSGSRPGISASLTHAATEVELQIAKRGTTYAFSYRPAGNDVWELIGNYTSSLTPQFVGLITKTWSRVHIEVDFDYLRLNSL